MQLITQFKILVVTLVILVGCKSVAPVKPPAPTATVITTGEIGNYPPQCSLPEIVQFMTRFFEAYNDADQVRLADFFDSTLRIPQSEGWFSDTLLRHFVSSSRAEILTYIVQRHTKGEKLRLTSLHVSGRTWHGGVDVAYTFARRASDLPTSVTHGEWAGVGKGAITCPEKKIFVWSMTAHPIAS